MSKAIILMSAVLPTTGHADLINFTRNLLHVESTHVLIGERSTEPFTGTERANFFRNHFNDPNVYFNVMNEDVAPKVDGTPEFWEWWGSRIHEEYPDFDWDDTIIVSAETYAAEVSEACGCTWLPYDIKRVINPTRGTYTRHNLVESWDNIMPTVKPALNVTVTMFGQESVGKTTLGKMLGKSSTVTYIPEWARLYLETVGNEITEKVMGNITFGQGALQRITKEASVTPFTVQDTDLFSTIGYTQIYGGGDTTGILEIEAIDTQSDMYYVLSDDIPFVPDELRYGGNVRESDTQFWVNLLNEYELPYVMVPSGTIEDKTKFIEDHMLKVFIKKNQAIISHQRVS